MERQPAIAPHTSSPADLQARIQAENAGMPFLLYRDAAGRQRIVTLPPAGVVTIGRRSTNDVAVDWDSEVSRVHARLERVGGEWTIVDDGLSRNGSWVNGARLTGRRRLADGDALRVGNTVVAFLQPGERESEATLPPAVEDPGRTLTETQRRILTALARPFREPGALATPATNREIAEEVFLSVDAVKGHLRVLFQKFGLQDLPQNQKRAQLVWRAFRSGAISATELWE